MLDGVWRGCTYGTVQKLKRLRAYRMNIIMMNMKWRPAGLHLAEQCASASACIENPGAVVHSAGATPHLSCGCSLERGGTESWSFDDPVSFNGSFDAPQVFF